MNDFAAFKKKVGIGALIILLVHVLLAVSTAVMPRKAIQKNMVTNIYNQLILLGPFFQESRIKSSAHLYVSFNKNGVWSPFRNYAGENFLMYKPNIFNYYRLHLSDFERYISNEVGSQKKEGFDEVKETRVFRELNQYVTSELIGETVDSVRLLYGLNVYLPDPKVSRFDTIFLYTYNPNQVAGAKK